MMLPQRPYFPIAPLAAAVAYPAEPGHYDSGKVAELITAVGLPALASRIEEEAHWNRILSLGEQQRLGLARALLHAPDYLFLDEATASLDEPSEAALYELLAQRLAAATIVSIGHRATLARSISAGWPSTATVITSPWAKPSWRRRNKFTFAHDLLRKPVPTPDQVRGHAFRDHAPQKHSGGGP